MTTHTTYVNGHKVGMLRHRILTAPVSNRETTCRLTAREMKRDGLIFFIEEEVRRITPTNYRTVIWYGLTEAGREVAEALR